MPTEPAPLTLSALVRRACAIVDPADEDGVVADFEQRFEDSDEPVTTIDSLEERIRWGADEDPPVAMAQALILYLAHRRTEVDDDPDRALRLAAESEWQGRPPAAVADWLAARGVDLP